GPTVDRVGPWRRLDPRLPIRALCALGRRYRVAPNRLEPRALGAVLRLAQRRDGNRGPRPGDLSTRCSRALTTLTRPFHPDATEFTKSVDNVVENSLKAGARPASFSGRHELVKKA